MSSAAKKTKFGPSAKPPTCKYEKARRDRLNLIITELSTFLPEQNPAKSLSKIDILEKIVHLIKQLLDDKEKLSNKNSADECLKQELKELRSTVSDLKARIVALNKILSSANIAVPIDLEVPCFDKSFTPHLRYSNRKRAVTCQSTQTEQEQPNSKPEEQKENEDESAEKLIAFTKKLKAPLKEIQVNITQAQPVPPTQIIIVPYYYPTPSPMIPRRPAMTQLTYSNKRPISSYTDFKRIYSQQQEKLERKRRRRRQKRKPSLLGGKKCTCKSVVLKKPDGALKKIIKLCGYKTCKNKTKFERIQEQAKQQQNEKAKEDKAKETQSAITVSKDNAEDKTKMQVIDAMYPGVVSEPCYYPCSNYFNTNYQPNMKHNHTSHGTDSDCPNEASNVKSDQRNIATKTQNVNHDITCSNMMVRHSIDSLNHKSSVNQDTEDNTRHEINHASHIESYNSMEQRDNTMVHDMPNSSNDTSRISNNNVGCYNASSDTNNRINSNVSSYNPSIGTNNRTSSSTNNSYIGSNETNNRINSHVNTDESYKNTNDTNNGISNNMGSYKHSNETNNRIGIHVGYYNSSSDSTSRINNNVNNESSYNSNDTNTRINSNVINVGSYKGSNNTGNRINGHSNTENSYNSSSDSNNRINSHVNTENSYNSNDTNNRVSNNVNNVGSYSINNVMSSSKTHTGDSPYQTQHNSSAIFQKVQHGEESNNANLNKRQVRKNLNFSFENLGSNVMSSDTNTCFGSNENTSGVLYSLPGQHDNTYNTPFSYKTNTLPSSDMSYVEPCQEKTSCYFESHPNALHFPTTSVSKPFDETKRKSGLKQKPDASSNTCHDISQNIFEVNNKENSFDFLFGKQNSLNTPQKSKRKSDSCLMSEKTFLLDEMRFHSDFSNDLFSLPGQVGGQNLECVSPTAAFLLTFPLVSSKHTELLTDNIESGNTATPIGNMESLSQDLFPPQTDFSFKSNMKGLFDPFYSSCIGTEFNVLDNVAKDDLLGKSNFPSCSENTGTGTAWSANIFNNEESPKKKTLADSTSQLLSLDKTKKHVEMKLPQSGSRSQDINSKCSQTSFSYAESSDVVSTSKSLVNWMTSSDKNTVAIQNEKKPSDKFTWSPNKALPIEPVLMFPPPTSTNFALTPSTTKTNSFGWQDGKDPSSSSTLGFFADSKNVTHSHTKDKTQEHKASHFSSNTIEVPISQCSENKTSSQTYSNNTRTDVKYNSSKLKEHSDKDNTNNSKSRKSLFDENPDKSIQYYYPNPPTSNSSSFLSVSQLVDPNKPASKDKTQSYTTKSNAIKKEAKFPSNLKEPIENNNKYKNYSTEALLSSGMPPPSSKTYKPVENKIRYKRKRNDNKASKITPGNLTNIYNVATTSSSALYSNSNYYVPPTTVSYYMGSASNEQNWNPSYSNSTNSSYDSYDNTTNKYLETSRENNVPSTNQNYFPSNTFTLAAPCCTSSSTSHYQNPIITSANHPGHSYVTSASYIPKYHNVTNTSHSTSKSSSISVGTQVVTSSFPCLPTNQNKVVLSGSNFSLSSSSNSTSCLRSTPQSSTASVLPSWHIPCH
ncbi:hypothetical protein M8J75_009511 [Diaphorina citri]|nr:hypothetical protein M8J75_009511 [Diaphorina citri]